MNNMTNEEKIATALIRVGAGLGIDRIIATEEQYLKAIQILKEEGVLEPQETLCQENINKPSLPPVEIIENLFPDGKAKRRARRKAERMKRKK